MEWVANQLILTSGDYPESSRWAQCNCKRPYERETRKPKAEVDVTTEARNWREKRKGPGAKECKRPLLAGKGEAMDSPL